MRSWTGAAGASSAEKLGVLLFDQLRRCRTGEPFSVEGYLERVPDLDQEAKLELAVGEFKAQRDLGQSPSVAEFVARFPDLGEALRDRLSASTGKAGGETRLRH